MNNLVYTQEPLPPRKWFIQMHPIAKERPRLNKFGSVYTPKSTQQAEKIISNYVKVNNHNHIYLGEHVINIKLYLQDGQRGDLDNYVKTVLDALNHAELWYDDKDIIKLSAEFCFVESDTDEGIGIEVKCIEIKSRKVKERIKRRFKNI